MERITSRTNALVAHIRKLAGNKKYRRASAEVVCEGPKLLEEALRWGAAMTVLVLQEGVKLPASISDSVRQVSVPEDLFSWMSDTESPQGVLFLCRIAPSDLPDTLPGDRFLVLDGLQDPGNVGTIWRTADALGADGLILLPGCADPWSSKTVRASMGACFRLPLWETSLSALSDRLERSEISLYAAALKDNTEALGAVSLEKAAVVIGSEGRGVSEPVLDCCDGTLKIPMRARCESLNAAAAATVILWEMGRQEREGSER